MTHPDGLPSRPTAEDLASLRWVKATASNGSESCVEVADLKPWIVVRDSKDPSGAVHCYTPRQWRSFLDVVRSGVLDHR
jgi:Domain of unknown function (DUF397)